MHLLLLVTVPRTWQEINRIKRLIASVQHVKVHVGNMSRRHVHGLALESSAGLLTYRANYLALHHHAHRHTQAKSVALHRHLPVALRLVPGFQAVLHGVHRRGGRLIAHTP